LLGQHAGDPAGDHAQDRADDHRDTHSDERVGHVGGGDVGDAAAAHAVGRSRGVAVDVGRDDRELLDRRDDHQQEDGGADDDRRPEAAQRRDRHGGHDEQRDPGDDDAIDVAADGLDQRLVVAAGVEVATPGDEPGPDDQADTRTQTKPSPDAAEDGDTE